MPLKFLINIICLILLAHQVLSQNQVLVQNGVTINCSYRALTVGQTIYWLADRYQVSVSELIRINNIQDVTRVTTDQAICVPVTTANAHLFNDLNINTNVNIGSNIINSVPINTGTNTNINTGTNNLNTAPITQVSTNNIVNNVAGCPNYLIRQGDTCFNLIANNLGSQNAGLFYNANPGIVCNNLQINQRICLPSLSNCNRLYYVRPGDTCLSISNAVQTSVTQLFSCNRLINSGCTNLYVGQPISF